MFRPGECDDQHLASLTQGWVTHEQPKFFEVGRLDHFGERIRDCPRQQRLRPSEPLQLSDQGPCSGPTCCLVSERPDDTFFDRVVAEQRQKLNQHWNGFARCRGIHELVNIRYLHAGLAQAVHYELVIFVGSIHAATAAGSALSHQRAILSLCTIRSWHRPSSLRSLRSPDLLVKDAWSSYERMGKIDSSPPPVINKNVLRRKCHCNFCKMPCIRMPSTSRQ
jgi:hypothetical protein